MILVVTLITMMISAGNDGSGSDDNGGVGVGGPDDNNYDLQGG